MIIEPDANTLGGIRLIRLTGTPHFQVATLAVWAYELEQKDSAPEMSRESRYGKSRTDMRTTSWKRVLPLQLRHTVATATDVRTKFLCGLGGYQVYRSVWNPVVNEVLRVVP